MISQNPAPKFLYTLPIEQQLELERHDRKAAHAQLRVVGEKLKSEREKVKRWCARSLAHTCFKCGGDAKDAIESKELARRLRLVTKELERITGKKVIYSGEGLL